MSVTTHELGLEAMDAIRDVDALCLFVGEEERPLRGASGLVDWRLCGALSRVLQEKFFTGTPGDWLLLPTSGRFPVPRVFVAGVGRSRQLGSDGLVSALASAVQTLRKAGSQGVALEIPGSGVIDDHARVSALQQTFLPAFRSGHVALLGDKAFTRLLSNA